MPERPLPETLSQAPSLSAPAEGGERLRPFRDALAQVPLLPWRGRVLEADGQSLTADGPAARMGEACEVRTLAGDTHEGQIIGFAHGRTLVMLTGGGGGVRYGDEVVALGYRPRLAVGAGLLGRVVDAQAEAIDGGPAIERGHYVPLEAAAPKPFARAPIADLLPTGIRAIDALLSVGKGQRMGIFGGSGVGKSTLLGMMTRNCAADVAVIGLVGERGREVLEFLNDGLGPEGRAKSVVMVATSDEAPLLKVRAALGATAIAEHFAMQGKDVLLIVDSLTRFAMAAREIGLAAGEPPTAKGYTPSVFSRLARMVERAGRFRRGSITAFYTVLMEGDDELDPVVDAIRSFVDGHLMLSRDLALEAWYPPIDVLGSISRLMRVVASPAHVARAEAVRRQLAHYARSEDMVRIGAYKPGSDPELDRAIAQRPALRGFLNQAVGEVAPFSEVLAQLETLAAAAGIAAGPAASAEGVPNS